MFMTTVIKCHSLSYIIFNATMTLLRCLCYGLGLGVRVRVGVGLGQIMSFLH